jgi:hypothetical protein
LWNSHDDFSRLKVGHGGTDIESHQASGYDVRRLTDSVVLGRVVLCPAVTSWHDWGTKSRHSLMMTVSALMVS